MTIAAIADLYGIYMDGLHRMVSNLYAPFIMFPAHGPTRLIRRAIESEPPMLDIVLIAAAFGFFAAAILYVNVCDRL